MVSYDERLIEYLEGLFDTTHQERNLTYWETLWFLFEPDDYDNDELLILYKYALPKVFHEIGYVTDKTLNEKTNKEIREIIERVLKIGTYDRAMVKYGKIEQFVDSHRNLLNELA